MNVPPARVLEVDPTSYHNLPGFSASLAKVLIAKSAAHAKDAYERMLEQASEADEGDEDEEPAEKQKRLDAGSVLHALILGIGKRVDVIPSSILSSNGAAGTAAARAFIATARAAGRIPVKDKQIEVHERVATAIKARIADAGHVLDGRSELAIEWHEQTAHGPTQCRCMLDHIVMWDDPAVGPGAIVYELKMVGDAHPEVCMRTAERLGYAIQAAAYQRALAALYPRLAGRITVQFLFCETRRPYAIWDPPRLSGAFREIGERRWMRAVNEWAEVMATSRPPSYREMGFDEITAPAWTLRSEGFQPEEF